MDPRQWVETIVRQRDEWLMRVAIARRLETYVGAPSTPLGRLRRLVPL
jgi:hypothetical protein